MYRVIDFFKNSRKCDYCDEFWSKYRDAHTQHCRAEHRDGYINEALDQEDNLSVNVNLSMVGSPMALRENARVTVSSVPTTPIVDLFRSAPSHTILEQPFEAFEVDNYTESVVQYILDGVFAEETPKGKVLVVGGDGTPESNALLNKIVSICAGNGIKKVLIGQGFEMYPPLVSNIVRKGYRGFEVDGAFMISTDRQPDGQIIVTFKYVASTGVSPHVFIMYKITSKAAEPGTIYFVPDLEYDGNRIEKYIHKVEGHGVFSVEVVDTLDEYVTRVKHVFKFDNFRDLLRGNEEKKKSPFRILVDARGGQSGKYTQRILGQILDVPAVDLLNMDLTRTPATIQFTEVFMQGKYDMGVEFDPVKGIKVWAMDGDQELLHIPAPETFGIFAFHFRKFLVMTPGDFGFASSTEGTAQTLKVFPVTRDRGPFNQTINPHTFQHAIDTKKVMWAVNDEKMMTDCSMENDMLGQLLAWLHILATTNVGPNVSAVHKKYGAKVYRVINIKYDFYMEDYEAALAVLQKVCDHLWTLRVYRDEHLGELYRFCYDIYYTHDMGQRKDPHVFLVDFKKPGKIVYKVRGNMVTMILDRGATSFEESDDEQVQHLKDFGLRISGLDQLQGHKRT